MTLLVAGQETSAILLGWVCADLAWHPSVQERAAHEVQVCVKPSGLQCTKTKCCLNAQQCAQA